MQSRMFNNPALAQGLSGLVQSFIGNPGATAKAELAASEALLNNQTAQYREAIGDTGLSGDLAAMMIRSLQAGPEYARYAPKLGNEALKFGSMGFGRQELTPTGPMAAMFRAASTPGRRGRSGSTAAPSASLSTSDLTQSELTRLDRSLRSLFDAQGYPVAEQPNVTAAVMEAYKSGEYGTLDEAAAAVLPQLAMEEVVVGTDPNVFWGEGTSFNPFDMFRGPEDITEQQLRIPSVGQPGQAEVNRPASKADYDALPSGAQFIDPEGNIRIKP